MLAINKNSTLRAILSLGQIIEHMMLYFPIYSALLNFVLLCCFQFFFSFYYFVLAFGPAPTHLNNGGQMTKEG